MNLRDKRKYQVSEGDMTIKLTRLLLKLFIEFKRNNTTVKIESCLR